MSKKYGDAQTLEKHLEEALKQNLMLRDELQEINHGLIALAMELEEKNAILDIASKHTQLVPFLNETLAYLKDYTGCAAVGIQLLDEEGNIPYQAYDGFSQSFYEKESPLSIKRDRCMCINVITGTTDPDQPFYTKGGSFYMNGTTKFLTTVLEEDKGQTRNACNQAGYESVAMIPIRMRDTLGLLHIADPREDMIPLDTVEALERAAMQMGTTIVRLRAEDALQRESGINETSAELSSALISSKSIEEISDLVLAGAKRFTGSEIGFVGYIEPETGYLICPTMTRDVWDMCRVPDKDIVFKEFGGLSGWVLNNRESLMVNTPAEDSRSTGTPTGHIPIRRFLSAPAFYNGILIGQIALANSDREYTEQDLKLVERLGELYAIAINRKRSEDELEHLASFPQLNPNPILELDAGGNVIFCNTATMDILDKAGLQGDVRVFLPPDLDALLDALKSEEEPVAFYHEVKIKGMTFDENIHLSKKHRVLRIYAFDITERKRAENALQESHARLVNNLEQIEASLASIAVMRDPYTAGHQVRVASLACAIAAEIGTPVERIGAIRTAAMLHDIGKIFVPQEILNKPGALNILEWSFVKTHAQASYEILKNIEFDLPIAEIVRQHHERLDGSGYPRGLSGDSIIKEARILAVSDVVEAMASYRPYRPALPLETALEEISSKKGLLYDAEVVDACLRLFAEQGFSQSIWPQSEGH